MPHLQERGIHPWTQGNTQHPKVIVNLQATSQHTMAESIATLQVRRPESSKLSHLLDLPEARDGVPPLFLTDEESQSVVQQADPEQLEALRREQGAAIPDVLRVSLFIPDTVSSVNHQQERIGTEATRVPELLVVRRSNGPPPDRRLQAIDSEWKAARAAHLGETDTTQQTTGATFLSLYLQAKHPEEPSDGSDEEAAYAHLIRGIQTWKRTVPLVDGSIRLTASGLGSGLKVVDHLRQASEPGTNLEPSVRLYAVDVRGDDQVRLEDVEPIGGIPSVSEDETSIAGKKETSGFQQPTEKRSIVVIDDQRTILDWFKVADDKKGTKQFSDFTLGPIAGSLRRAANTHPELLLVYSIPDSVSYSEDSDGRSGGLEHEHYLTATDLGQLQSELNGSDALVTTSSRMPLDTYLEGKSTPSEFAAATREGNAKYTPPEDSVRHLWDTPRPPSSRARGGYFNRRGGRTGPGQGRGARDAGNNSDGTPDE